MTLDSQIAAILDPTSGVVGSDYDGNGMIVQNHVTQMKMFGIRQGIELYPEQDDELGSRKRFIEQVWEYNELDLYQDLLWDWTLCAGEMMIYYRPNSDNYIH